MFAFAYRFKLLRESYNLTQNEVAKEFEVTQNTISYWESGKQDPDMSLLQIIASFFNVDIDFLLGNYQPSKERYIIEFAKLREWEIKKDSQSQKKYWILRNSLEEVMSDASKMANVGKIKKLDLTVQIHLLFATMMEIHNRLSDLLFLDYKMLALDFCNSNNIPTELLKVEVNTIEGVMQKADEYILRNEKELFYLRQPNKKNHFERIWRGLKI